MNSDRFLIFRWHSSSLNFNYKHRTGKYFVYIVIFTGKKISFWLIFNQKPKHKLIIDYNYKTCYNLDMKKKSSYGLAPNHAVCELKLVLINFEVVFLVLLILSYIFDDFPIQLIFVFSVNSNTVGIKKQ